MPSPQVARPHEFSEFVEDPAIEGGRRSRSNEGSPHSFKSLIKLAHRQLYLAADNIVKRSVNPTEDLK